MESRIRGLKRGADAYIPKPFDREELLVRIANLLELRKSLQKRYSQAGTIIMESTAENDLSLTIEDKFILRVRKVVDDHLNDYRFNVDRFARAMSLSRTQLYRKLIALTGKSPVEYIRWVRLSHATSLLKASEYTISEIAYRCGFSDPGYFSRVFSQEFGCPPTEYRQGILDFG